MGQSFSTHIRKGGGGRAKVYIRGTRGRGLHIQVRTQNKKVPFCMYSIVLSQARYSCFIAFLKNICYDYFPVSQILYRFSLHGLFAGYLKPYLIEMGGGGQICKSTYEIKVQHYYYRYFERIPRFTLGSQATS